jgi:hypothetical protein
MKVINKEQPKVEVRHCSECLKAIPRKNRDNKILKPYNYKQRMTCCDDCAGRRRSRKSKGHLVLEAIDYFNRGELHLITV